MITYKSSLEGIEPTMLQGFFVGWRQSLTEAQHFTILQNSSHIVLALEDDKVVGFINALSDRVHFAFIPMLEVLPEYQNNGIGRELTNRMLGQLAGLTCIDLTCDKDMQGYYEQFGMFKSHGMVIRKY